MQEGFMRRPARTLLLAFSLLCVASLANADSGNVRFSVAKDALKPVVKWVESDGIPSSLPAGAAQLLGVGQANEQDLLTKQIAYQLDAKPVIYTFDVAVVDGRAEYLMRRLTPEFNLIWRFTPDGEILNTISILPGARRKVEANSTYGNLFRESAEFFVSRVPKTSVQ